MGDGRLVQNGAIWIRKVIWILGWEKGNGEIYTLIAPPSRGPWLEMADSNCFYNDIGRFVCRVIKK